MTESEHAILAKPFKLAGKKVWIAGATGMVGSATVRRLASENCDILTPTRQEVDLVNQASVNNWISANKPDVVVVAAATVGGILANSTRPAEFIYNNIAIESNVIHASYLNDVEKLLFLGSACIYPREASQPMAEEALLTGPLEPTNEWYAIAKIAGIKMCEAYRKQYGCDYISAQPNNLYGLGDNFDLESSHVIPALMHRAHLAKIAGDKTLTIWGTGKVFREFLHVDDCADALVHLLRHYSGAIHINMGTGEEVTIGELAQTIADVVGFEGSLKFDTSKPDGSPRKLLDNSRLEALNWKSSITLRDGLASTYDWFLENIVD
ncbi:MAG: GDP-L-fucose synthase [Rhodospirillaceae bacterium]|jgi:GDP-L-fucose synthase|nr:GDP-L-fucose synthase [Rhodospirillaceae bacterium]MBT5938936.1 GDP-L-fucose synthase [Rhodospirillaceae bacterium]MBT7266666.1 GDP-L-fucose synthase [Rhodospirillaceae bacterium]